MLTEDQLEEKRKQRDQWWNDNQTQYYGLSIEEVQVVLREYDDLLDTIRTLQQQNKRAIELLGWFAKRTAIDRSYTHKEEYEEVVAMLQHGESHDS